MKRTVILQAILLYLLILLSLAPAIVYAENPDKTYHSSTGFTLELNRNFISLPHRSTGITLGVNRQIRDSNIYTYLSTSIFAIDEIKQQSNDEYFEYLFNSNTLLLDGGVTFKIFEILGRDFFASVGYSAGWFESVEKFYTEINFANPQISKYIMVHDETFLYGPAFRFQINLIENKNITWSTNAKFRLYKDMPYQILSYGTSIFINYR